MTTGTVSLSLADVDKLRNDIKDGETKIRELEALLAEVKADKRVMKVTSYDYKINPKDIPFSVDVPKLNHVLNTSRGSLMWIEPEVKTCIHFHPLDIRNQDTKTEYVNFEDVKGEIRQELDKQYNEEIGELREEKRKQIQKIAELKAQFQEESVQEQQLWQKEAKGLQDKIDAWEKKYEDLKEDRDTRTEIEKLEAQILELAEELDKEKGKSWFQKLIGK